MSVTKTMRTENRPRVRGNQDEGWGTAAQDTFPKLLLRNYRRWGHKKVAWRKKRYGIWTEYTWTDCYEKVKALSLGLIHLGLQPGDVVSILGDNNPEWYWSELAVQSAGGAIVGLFPDASPEEIRYIVDHSQSKFVIAEGQEQVDKLLAIKGDLPLLSKIVYWDEKGLSQYGEPILTSFDAVLKSGDQYEKTHAGLFEQNIASGSRDDLATIQYTSGTTGLPKGVMITYDFSYRFMDALLLNPVYEDDDYVSVTLPGWVVEQGFGLFPSLLCGQRYNFAENAQTVQADVREIAPHSVLYSSRLWEQICSTAQTKVADSLWIKRMLYRLCLPIGYRIADLSAQGRKPNLPWRLLYAMADLAVFRPLRDKHGLVRMRIAYTAGAMLAPEVIRFFRAIGVNLRQFFGSTEGGGASAHKPDDVKPESVGMILPNRCIRIADDGEILLDTAGCSKGYFRDQEATDKVFRGNWFHSGDAGYIDDDGHLVFMDRLKDMRQLASGERFSPQYIESRLKFSLYIKDSIVLGGEQREYLAAIITIDFDNVGRWAEKRNIPYTTFVDLSQKPQVADLVRKEIETINLSLPPSSRIRTFVNLHKEFDADEAEMTRSRKLRRAFVEDRYKDLVEALYGKDDEVEIAAPVVYRDGRRAVVNTRIKIVRLQ